MKTGLFFLEISGNQELNTNIFEKYLNISHGNSKFSSFCFKQIEGGGGGGFKVSGIRHKNRSIVTSK